MFKFCYKVLDGSRKIAEIDYGFCLDFVEPRPVQYSVRAQDGTVVGTLEVTYALRAVDLGLPDPAPRSAVPAVPAVPEVPQPEVHLSRLAELEQIFLSATARSPVSLAQLMAQPDALGQEDPKKSLSYMQASRVKSSGSAPLKTRV